MRDRLHLLPAQRAGAQVRPFVDGLPLTCSMSTFDGQTVAAKTVMNAGSVPPFYKVENAGDSIQFY